MSIEVECYSGSRADERPLRLRLDSRWLEIRHVVRQWREPDAELFEIETSGGKRYRLRHGPDDAWTLDEVRGLRFPTGEQPPRS